MRSEEILSNDSRKNNFMSVSALMLWTREASTKQNHQEVINLKSLNFPSDPSRVYVAVFSVAYFSHEEQYWHVD